MTEREIAKGSTRHDSSSFVALADHAESGVWACHDWSNFAETLFDVWALNEAVSERLEFSFFCVRLSTVTITHYPPPPLPGGQLSQLTEKSNI